MWQEISNINALFVSLDLSPAVQQSVWFHFSNSTIFLYLYLLQKSLFGSSLKWFVPQPQLIHHGHKDHCIVVMILSDYRPQITASLCGVTVTFCTDTNTHNTVTIQWIICPGPRMNHYGACATGKWRGQDTKLQHHRTQQQYRWGNKKKRKILFYKSVLFELIRHRCCYRGALWSWFGCSYSLKCGNKGNNG